MTAARAWTAATAIALLAFASSCSIAEGLGGGEEPPESIYTQAEAYEAMEAAAAETAGTLPDFPGFEGRLWLDHPCSHDGVEDPDYVSVELEYAFSEADAQTPLVREQYADALLEQWEAAGYEILLDDERVSSERTDRSIIAYDEKRELEYLYRVAYTVTLVVTSGCMPVSEPADFTYVPPLGGVEPGGEHDNVGDFFPDGIPA
ncbi:hypothetical protein [Glycomyces sp. NPDC048151]|uniref:hypothetical protein n=1 Tax=Glycomyces sp. NPDC048151 TaxID=3364002 RepID=UPI00371B06CB